MRRLFQSVGDKADDGAEVAENVVVGDAQDAVTERLKLCLPGAVCVAESIVAPPVHLDDQPRLGTAEVCNVPQDRMLAQETDAEASAAEAAP